MQSQLPGMVQRCLSLAAAMVGGGWLLGAPPLLAQQAPRSAADRSSGQPQTTREARTRLVLNRKRRQVTLYRGDTPVESYPVAVGKPGWETPTGTFKVERKVRDPTWVSPFSGEVVPSDAPDNPIGDYWLGFARTDKNVIGFHDTPRPSSVGKAASHGCVRLYRDDMRELFSRVTVGTPVQVVDRQVSRRGSGSRRASDR